MRGWAGGGCRRATRCEAARTDLTQAREALLDQRPDDATTAVAAAGERTARARDLTSDPVWRVAAHVPIAGRTIAVVRGLAEAADTVARDALPPAVEAAQDLEPSQVRRADGSIDLAAVRRSQAPVRQLTEQVVAAQREIAGLPSRRVLPLVARARTQLSVRSTSSSRPPAAASRRSTCSRRCSGRTGRAATS